MKCTILGGQGFIGRHLVSYLESLENSVWVPDRDDQNVLKKSLGYVYYCAGFTADYLKRPVDTIEAHVSLLARILDSADYETLVYLSSTRLYDGQTKGLAADENSYLNVSPQDPRHFYDLSKLTGEALCHVMGQGKARIARLSCVYNDHSDEDGFLPQLLKMVALASRGDTINVASSPNFARDYVHISDVMRALVDISNKGVQTIYNVASGENLLNLELKKMIEENSERYLVFDSDESARCPITISINKIRDEFGWLPRSVSEKITPWLKSLS